MKRPLMVMPSVLFGLALVLAGCGGSSTATGTSASSKVSVTPPTSLIKSGTLTDCVDIEYSPMEYFASASVTDPNQAVGFDVDGARAVAEPLANPRPAPRPRRGPGNAGNATNT